MSAHRPEPLAKADARGQGLFGRSVVHPRQIEPVHRVFTRDADELAAARALLGSMRDHTVNGVAAWVDERGRFVDPAVVRSAQWLVERADGIRTDVLHERGTAR